MFDDIRPYNNDELPAAMQRIAADKYFPLVCDFLFPGVAHEKIAVTLGACRSAEEFQRRIMYDAIWSIAHKTTDGLTVSGLDKLEPGKTCLYVSNHRDIMMDAAFLQVLLLDAGLRTSEITFGANLMHGQLVIDVGKSNKMFRIERPTTVTSVRDFLSKSQYVSEYIRYTLREKGESVWIAQRNGRTKDGMDATDQGIIKMFGMSGGKDKVQALAELNIVPLSISYEWEPCDQLKALELYARDSGQPYIKKPGEDFNSILTGITQPKGRVHLAACTPITAQDLEPLRELPGAAFNREVASLIDRRILKEYRLYPNNYIAAWLLCGKKLGDFTPEQEQAFVEHIDTLVQDYPERIRDILLHIYANPVLRTL